MIIVDTSVIIDFLRGYSNHYLLLEKEEHKKKVKIFIPDVVIVELFTGQEARKKSDRQRLDNFLKDLRIVNLNISSAKLAGDLIRTYAQIPDPFDLIIAAIALDQNAQIATHNTKHFKQIRGLKLFDFSKIGILK